MTLKKMVVNTAQRSWYFTLLLFFLGAATSGATYGLCRAARFYLSVLLIDSIYYYVHGTKWKFIEYIAVFMCIILFALT